VAIPAVETGLQRGMLVMQAADNQFTRPGRRGDSGRRVSICSKSAIGNRQSQIRSILFKNKDDQFRTSAMDRANG
jgi:hypothetical protein